MLSLTSTRYVLNKGRLTSDAESVLPLVYQDDDWYVYEHPPALPRAFAVHRAIKVSTGDEALAYLRDREFDPLSPIILEGEKPLPPGMAWETSGALSLDLQDEVAITSYTPSSVEIHADLSKDGFLVLLDSYYPGWQVTVDGQAETVWRAYYFARAVYLDSGRHTVRFVYRPLSFYGGVGLATAGLLIIVVAATLTRVGPEAHLSQI
jgi:hypothetical protein